MGERSPFAPKRFPALPAVSGVLLGGASCGVKYKGRKDLFLATLEPGSALAGVFTKSKTASAPVEWCRKHLRGGKARAIIVNSGNANAFTGRDGLDAVVHTVDGVVDALGCRPAEVFVASTGVIGEKMSADRITAVLPRLVKRLRPNAWKDAAAAIMTTDTYAKGASASCEISGKAVTISGIAKGSGMIAPDMATMLSFVFTDARLPQPVLQRLLRRAVDRTFNCVTVDGDTSTSDTVLLAATGKARNRAPDGPSDPALAGFREALEHVLRDLALQVVRDGEGASKFVTIDVTGAESTQAARRIGLSVANSPLVKTAIAGEDANWGRIVMAVGKAGEKANRDRLDIAIGGVTIARAGERVPDYDEAPVARHMKGREIDVAVHVGVGRGRARVWTCDLTHGYIAINADYRS